MRRLLDGDDRDAEELDVRTRQQYFAILQYLREHEFVQALTAFEKDCGITYNGELPVASLLEASLDMFAGYCGKAEHDTGGEEVLLVERGICCTSEDADSPSEAMGANVTAVAWAATGGKELVALSGTADRRIRLLGPKGGCLAEFGGLSSPPLSIDVSPAADRGAASQIALVTCMGGEVALLRLARPNPAAEDGKAELDMTDGWGLELAQQFKNHTKHVTSGRFAPPAAAGSPCPYFVTVSRDHQAKVYRREGSSDEFALHGSVQLAGEVTCCCWAGDRSFVLAARDDHHLHYWDVDGGPSGELTERMKVNLNATGDSVVSFTVLALAASPDLSLIAACTDKSRIIIFEMFGTRQLRNLYGTTIDEYDIPSVCFSLDRSFLYATSSQAHRALEQRCAETGVVAMCGEVVIFEVLTGEAVLRLPCHSKPVRCMARHPHTEALVTGSFDRTVKFWS